MAETTVYIYRDAREVILYVGVTERGHRRAEEHSAKVWWTEIASASFIHVATREAALNLEALFIETLHPLHNIQHRDPSKDARAMSHAEFMGPLPDPNQDVLDWRRPKWRDLGPSKPKQPPLPEAFYRKPQIPDSWTPENVESMLKAIPRQGQRIKMWMALDKETKRTVGCIQCWRPRSQDGTVERWDGASCPECFSAYKAKSKV